MGVLPVEMQPFVVPPYSVLKQKEGKIIQM